MVVPKQTLKRQIKTLHPSCSNGSLKSLSNNGIRRVEAVLGFFCQVPLACSSCTAQLGLAKAHRPCRTREPMWSAL